MIQKNKYYEIFKGTSQKDRYKREIMPSYVKIDGMTLADILQFVSQYAELIKFYGNNSKEQKTENWRPFFMKDNLIILISISNYKIFAQEKNIQELLNKALDTKDQKLKIRILRQVVKPILVLGESLEYVRKNVHRDEQTSDLIFDISNAIQRELKSAIITLYEYKSTLQWDEETETKFVKLLQDWREWDRVKDNNLPIKTITFLEQEEIKSIYQNFFFTSHHIIEQAKDLLKKIMLDMKNNKPHIALYLAFLKLFKYAQDLQNEIPQKHLDFYYREVLKQKERAVQPDEVLVNVELTKGLNQFYLPQNTHLDAGLTELGEQLIYSTSLPVGLTNSKVLKLKTVFNSFDNRNKQKPNSQYVTGIYSGELNRKNKAFFDLNELAAFGEEQVLKSKNERTLSEADIGFLIASPVLNLASGKRAISFTLEFEDESYNRAFDILKEVSSKNNESLDQTIFKAFSTGFQIEISQKNGCKLIHNYGFSLDHSKASWLFDFNLELGEDEFCNQEQDKLLPTNNPFIVVKLKHECSLFMYSLMQELKLKNIKIKTHSQKLSDCIIYNNIGEINPDKPFELFGAVPQRNNYFVLGHQEIFSKNISQLMVSFKWFSLPILNGGIEEYFKEYKNEQLNGYEENQLLTNDYYLKPNFLKEGDWVESEVGNSRIKLFENETEDGRKLNDRYSEYVNFEIDSTDLITLDSNIPNPYVYDRNSFGGFIRFDLICPQFGLGHAHYAKLLSETVLKNSNLKKKEHPIKVLKEPFSPQIQNLELEYKSSAQAYHLNANKGSSNDIDFYHITPFGYKKMELKSTDFSIDLISVDRAHGNLYLGLDSYPNKGEISLLFILDDDKVLDRESRNKIIKWSYLSNNIWIDFGENNIVTDTTNGFINSGIIRLRIPKNINRNNTIVSDDLLWVKISIFGEVSNLGNIVSISENGVHAIWDHSIESNHLEEQLPPYSINKTMEEIPEISKVNQNISSFGGRKPETETHFYNRISERLRHKNRAITVMDYEELVLEEFPEVFKVKCFMAQHTLDDNYKSIENLILPGSVKIAVVADSRLNANRFRPKVSAQTLMNIENYLLKFNSPFVQVSVHNPFYEQVRVICKVIFNNEESDSYNEINLHEDIISYLNPWMKGDDEEEFGKSMFKSEVLAFIQNLDYVDFVTEFSMVKILDHLGHYSLYDTAGENAKSGEIKPLFPWSILVSAREHDITIITDQSYGSALPRGISNMKIGTDFIISN